MSHFSRHLVYGLPEPKYKIVISRELKNEKTGAVRLMPTITFYNELDPDEIIEKAHNALENKFGKDWHDVNFHKFHIEVIPPDDDE
jgi:hypothetical protein